MAGAVTGYGRFEGRWGECARLARDTLAMKATVGIPTAWINVMDIPLLEHVAGRSPGDYARDPEGVYVEFQRRVGACLLDQYIPRNPLTMGGEGYDERAERTATTGADRIVLDGVEIDSPESVVEHMETRVFPQRAEQIKSFDEDARVEELVAAECALQGFLGTDILKIPYGGFQCFPYLGYVTYGYANYFAAFALYPEVMERDFAQQADRAELLNRAAARAILDAGLPRQVRLDHDMADSRGTLVNLAALDRIWFPHFARAIAPLVEAGIRLIWHCDGNLMQMVPRLIEAGVSGFQGFQYEDGMDYPDICRMTDRQGGPLFIWAGASVTRTLPFGTPADVARELRWLVDNGPPRGLCLGVSSSITPGTKRENVLALIEGLRHYRRHGRG